MLILHQLLLLSTDEGLLLCKQPMDQLDAALADVVVIGLGSDGFLGEAD